MNRVLALGAVLIASVVTSAPPSAVPPKPPPGPKPEVTVPEPHTPDSPPAVKRPPGPPPPKACLPDAGKVAETLPFSNLQDGVSPAHILKIVEYAKTSFARGALHSIEIGFDADRNPVVTFTFRRQGSVDDKLEKVTRSLKEVREGAEVEIPEPAPEGASTPAKSSRRYGAVRSTAECAGGADKLDPAERARLEDFTSFLKRKFETDTGEKPALIGFLKSEDKIRVLGSNKTTKEYPYSTLAKHFGEADLDWSGEWRASGQNRNGTWRATPSDSDPLKKAFLDAAFSLQIGNALTFGLGGRLKARASLTRSETEGVIAAARAWLVANDVSFEEIKLPDGELALRIDAKSDGPALNRFAHEIKERYGTELVYSPEVLYVSGGMFRGSDNRLFLSHQAVAGAQQTPVEMHERLHALFSSLRSKGILVPFHVRFSAPEDGEKKIVEGMHYNYSMSAEEVAGYTLNTTIGLSRLKQLQRQGKALDSEEAQSELKGVRLFVRMGGKVSKAAATLGKQALEKIEKDPSVMVAAKSPAKAPDGTEFFVISFEVDVDGVKVKVPAMTMTEAKKIEADLKAKVQEGTLPRTALADGLMDAMKASARERLRAMVDLSEGAGADFDAIAQALGASPDAGSIDKALKRAQALNLGVNKEAKVPSEGP